MPTQTSTMVGVVQAIGFLQLFGVSLSPRLVADRFELENSYHGLDARAIRTCSPPLRMGSAVTTTAPAVASAILIFPAVCLGSPEWTIAGPRLEQLRARLCPPLSLFMAPSIEIGGA